MWKVGLHGPQEGHRVLRLGDDRVREGMSGELRLELVPADVGEVRLDAGGAKRFHFRERRRGGSGPPVSGGKVKNLHLL